MSATPATRSQDLARTTFQLLTLGALIATSFWIIRPFLVSFTWAATIVIATWPVLEQVPAWFGNRRTPAVALMTVTLLLFLVVPLYFVITTIVDNTAELVEWSKSAATLTVPPPPEWVQHVPLIGASTAQRWQQLASAGPEELAAHLAPFAQTLALWFVARVGSIGRLFGEFLLAVIIAAILYARGELVVRGVDRFARRLAGPRGENALHLGAQAVRAVALGVVVTAIVQSVLSGIGLAVAGVPFVAILTAVMFILAIAQIGAGPVLLVATIWIYTKSGALIGTVFLIWAIFCATFDNVLRPMLIKRGAHLPLLLIFVGVIGGLIAFGVIGLFIGPVVLAIAYTLLAEWVNETAVPDENRKEASREVA